mmetsp:Transcript_73252/g.145718  ORF Transcript_73252/g.145718 Transcript_73252/m.145718 type:complete len:206 (-) Transcript_73252:950-1567(-)
MDRISTPCHRLCDDEHHVTSMYGTRHTQRRAMGEAGRSPYRPPLSAHPTFIACLHLESAVSPSPRACALTTVHDLSAPLIIAFAHVRLSALMPHHTDFSPTLMQALHLTAHRTLANDRQRRRRGDTSVAQHPSHQLVEIGRQGFAFAAIRRLTSVGIDHVRTARAIRRLLILLRRVRPERCRRIVHPAVPWAIADFVIHREEHRS